MDFSHLSVEAIQADPLWLVIQTILIFVICFAIGKIHEFLHVYKAKKLGYKLISYKLFKNEVNIDIEEGDPNVKKIVMFPYVVLVPLGWSLLPIGWYLDSFAIFMAGFVTVIIHGLSLKGEGKQ